MFATSTSRMVVAETNRPERDGKYDGKYYVYCQRSRVYKMSYKLGDLPCQQHDGMPIGDCIEEQAICSRLP